MGARYILSSYIPAACLRGRRLMISLWPAPAFRHLVEKGTADPSLSLVKEKACALISPSSILAHDVTFEKVAGCPQ